MPDWIKLRLSAPQAEAETCAQLLLDAGCGGAQIDDCAVLFDESEDATIALKVEATITGYLTARSQLEPAQKLLETALQRGSLLARLEVEIVAAQDWSTVWRENFPPLDIGRFRVVPSWEAAAPPGSAVPTQNSAIIINLDPGLAFGTGQHPTTRMCLELVGDYVRSEAGVQPTLLDVGCGSGILSIAAAKLGARVTASDLDPFCVEATRDNTRTNEVTAHIVRAAGLQWTTGHFDFVIANLMSALLVALAPSLAAVARPGGTLIVSGISAPRAAEVEAALHEAGFTTIERRDQDGEQRGDFTERWSAFVLQR